MKLSDSLSARRASWGSPSRSGLAANLQQRDRLVEAFHMSLTCGFESQPLAGAKVCNDAADQHLARVGTVANTCRQLYGRAEKVIIFGDGLARVLYACGRGPPRRQDPAEFRAPPQQRARRKETLP